MRPGVMCGIVPSSLVHPNQFPYCAKLLFFLTYSIGVGGKIGILELISSNSFNCGNRFDDSQILIFLSYSFIRG